MRKIPLLLLLVFLGCATQVRAGGSVHVSGGYGCGYHGSSCEYGHFYCYAPGYYVPIFYSTGYYAYPGSYDDSAPYVVYSPPSTPSDNPGASPPAPATAPTPAPAPQINQQKAPNPIPYGFNIGTKLVQSPWSGFVINGATKAPEQVVYDANTGQAFRIPPL